MIESLIPSFSDECAKIAAASPLLPLFKAEAFHSDEKKNWSRFEKDLRSKTFQQAMLQHEKTQEDPKLRKYVRNVGAYNTSKTVVALAESRSGKPDYKVKRLTSGRLACGCKDWQYKHSWKGTDCDHIRAVKRAGLHKTSSAMLPFYRGMGMMAQLDKNKAKKLKAH